MKAVVIALLLVLVITEAIPTPEQEQEDTGGWFGWFKKIKNGVVSFYGYLEEKASNAWNWVKDKATAAYNSVKESFTNMFGSVEFKDVMKTISDAVDWLQDKFKNGFSDEDKRKLQKMMNVAIDKVQDYVKEKFESIKKSADEKIQETVDKVVGNADEIRALMKSSELTKLQEKCEERHEKKIQNFETKTSRYLKKCSGKFIVSLVSLSDYIMNLIEEFPFEVASVISQAGECFKQIMTKTWSWSNLTCLINVITNVFSLISGVIGDVVTFKGMLLGVLKKVGSSGACVIQLTAQIHTYKDCITTKVKWCMTKKVLKKSENKPKVMNCYGQFTAAVDPMFDRRL